MFRFENDLEKTIYDEVQIYAEKEYTSQLITIMLSKDVSSHISVSVDSMNLFESNIAFAHYMFQNPRRALQLLDDAFQKVSLSISKKHVLKADMIYKENFHVRLIALPNLPEVYRSNLPSCSDVGQFLCISGTVVRASTAKMLQYKKQWRCGKCKYEFLVEAEVEQGYVCEKPLMCNNPEWCNGKNFTLMSSDINTEWCKDYQEIKLQEQVYNLNVGTVPKSMWVVLENDLVESCHPGNDVIVSGVLIQQWKPLTKGSLIDIQLVILAHNIEVQNTMSSGVISKDMAKEFGQFWQDHKSDPLKGRNFILSSICPQVFGLYIVKLAVALVLAGGVQKRSGNSKIRGDSHLLLVGDPGTAKSQFLKFATKASSRSVLTSGIGTTNAGLTVSAVKESGRWMLEAGALVLADGGICCIDEFSCIKEQDKTCIHEAMEQQTISVAKAGLVCSLNTRCSILAATNPKGKYDENMSISENTALGSPLLSRFDIILVLLDTYDEKWDDMVSSYILDGRNVINENNSKLWSVTKIKNYFTLIRHIDPKVTSNAERILRAYYTRQRNLQSRHSSRTTPRLLQSLIRLAEGHARLMFRTEVLVVDAVIAIILVESSMLSNSILEGLSPLHTVFPNNPMTEYVQIAGKVFQNLFIDLSPSESYEYFYEETNLNNLLSNISAVWGTKENPFIFRSPSDDRSSYTDQFLESGVDAKISTTSELHNFPDPSENTEDLFFKNVQESNYSTRISSPVQVITMEVEGNNDDTSIHVIQNESNQISTLSDLRNIFGDDMTDVTPTSAFNMKIHATKSNENLSVLDQILEEQDFHECSNISVNPTLNKPLGIKNIFNNPVSQTTKYKNNEMLATRKTCMKGNVIPQKKFVEIQSEKSSVDIFQELGISTEREFEKHKGDSAGSLTEISSYFLDKPISISNIFPAKRSIADQLKNFAFSRSQSTQSTLINKGMSSVNVNESKSNLTLDIMPQIKKYDYIGNKKSESQYTDKKFLFNMIKNKCENNSNHTSECNIMEDLPKSSNILQNDQYCSAIYNQNSQNTEMMTKDNKTLLGIPENNQQYDHQFITEEPNSKLSTNVKQSQSTIGKKPVSDKLKMFVFSKTKISKAQNSINTTKN